MVFYFTSCQEGQNTEIKPPTVIEIVTSFSQAYKNVNMGCEGPDKTDFKKEENECEEPKQEATNKDRIDYFNCLVTTRLRSKSKSELMNDIKQTGITSRSNSGGYNQGYISFEALMKVSNLEDYQKMLRNDCPSVRYYGYLGICLNYPNAVYGELKTLVGDSTVVPTHFGCLVDVKTLSELYYETVTVKYRNEDRDRKYEIYQLTEDEKIKIDYLRPGYKLVFKDN